MNTDSSAPWGAPNGTRVHVRGGDLFTARWGQGSGPPVLGIHGITANRLAFARLAEELAGRSGPPMIVPDLRGRGFSSDLRGPHGLIAHVDDMVAVLDDHGVERTVVVGHSMGAFVACLLAVRHPERVTGLLLIDGGYGLPVAPGTDIDTVLGPALARLRMTFASQDEYRRFWRKHPAFTGRWSPWVERYALSDLVGREPRLYSRVDEESVRVDGAQVLSDPEVLAAIHRLPRPARLLWTARGLMDESPGLYTAERLAGLPEDVVTIELPDDNHYSPLFSSTAALVAQQVHTLVEQTVQVQGEL